MGYNIDLKKKLQHFKGKCKAKVRKYFKNFAEYSGFNQDFNHGFLNIFAGQSELQSGTLFVRLSEPQYS